MISHESDGSAVRDWIDRDPLLARMIIPHGAPDVSLVGGAVRDALLGVTHGADVDLVVEGDAILLARSIGRQMGGRVIAHERFGTARVEFAHGRHVDMVGARSEHYPSPGALPEVTPGSLADDLARRDFTVNASAFRLSGDRAGELVDPHGGRADISDECLRALRSGAFREDPSRAIRALRYAARLGFRMDEETAGEARACIGDLDISSARVADELRRLLHEDSADDALNLAVALGATWVDTDARRSDRLRALPVALARPGAPEPPHWALRLGVGLAPDAAASVAFPQWSRAVAVGVREGLLLAPELLSAERPSQVDCLLRDRSAATQIGAFIGGAGCVSDWWGSWRDATPDVNGSDLVAAGIPPGPGIGRALAALRVALLDGLAADRDSQMAIALAAAGDDS